MSATFITIIVGVLGAGVVFWVVRRMIRMAIRVALVFALLFALLVGGVWTWWRSSSSEPSQNSRPANARPARPRS